MAHPQYTPISKPTPTTTTIKTVLFTTLALLLLLLTFTLHSLNQQQPPPISHPATTFLSLSSNATLSHYLHSLTLHPHLAGTHQSHSNSLLITSHFASLNLPTHSNLYHPLLSYPLHSSLSAAGTGVLLPEEINPTLVVTPYHAYSPSGTVVGKAVFANYGREEDYRELRRIGVEVKGCVVFVRRGGGVSRGGVARIAAAEGAGAVAVYDEGMVRGGVERGTVMRGVGDPLSAGWAAVEGGERSGRGEEAVEGRFPRVPSMPVSVETAEAVLGALGGAGAPVEWGARGVARVGPGPNVLNFSYEGEEKMATIEDIFAVIEGYEEPDRYVLLGNHRDAWTYGAVDPNSGTAALLDIARRFAYMMRLGWKPRRTIVLCSWDAEEFGMIGSTEWVEQNLVNLGSKAVAYLNVDCAAQGPGFFAGATPQLDDLLVEVTKMVKDPEAVGRTVYDQWTTANKDIAIQRLSGVDSDFAPFVHHAGVPSIDMYYGKDFPVYHTAFDSYDWMVTYGDPLFHRHEAVANLWGLLALRLADDPILPFNYLSYATQLQNYANILSKLVDGRITIDPINSAIQHLFAAARKVNDEVKKLQADEASGALQALRRRMVNDKLMLAERALLDADGVPTMEWFKHLIYGPSGIEGKHDLTAFPSIVNAIYRSEQPMKAKDQKMIQHEVWRVSRAVQRAADALNGLIS